MDRIKKNFGFGCMRLPEKDGKIDTATVCEMVDLFLERGFNYFDTAHGYHGGKSELALKECLVDRYPRDAYIYTNKLSDSYFNRADEVRPFFEQQLTTCGVEYFDFYLMHAQCADLFEKYKRCRAYETAFELKAEGKIRHVGISFHDSAEVLDRILTEYPQIEIVQIQFNYLDYDDPAVQSRACYEVCRRHNKPVIVMEPCKGGHIVNMPDEMNAVLAGLKGGSNASYALRFAAGFEGVKMVLSGMGSMEMVRDNLNTMENFQPLSGTELAAVAQVCALFRGKNHIACTACRYCVEGCPQNIAIPDLFACLNAKTVFEDWGAKYYYDLHTVQNGKASACIECGACEHICPQHLPIRALLKTVADTFEETNA